CALPIYPFTYRGVIQGEVALGDRRLRIELLVGIADDDARDGVLVGNGASLGSRPRRRRLVRRFAVVRCRRGLANHVGCALVGARPQEHWMTQGAVIGPFGEGHLGDEYRAHPVGTTSFRALWRVVERAFVLAQGR